MAVRNYIHKQSCTHKQAGHTADRLSHQGSYLISEWLIQKMLWCTSEHWNLLSFLSLHSRFLCFVYPPSHSADLANSLITHEGWFTWGTSLGNVCSWHLSFQTSKCVYIKTKTESMKFINGMMTSWNQIKVILSYQLAETHLNVDSIKLTYDPRKTHLLSFHDTYLRHVNSY